MATPIPSTTLSPLNILNTITLPINNKSYTQGINIGTLIVENSFLDISLVATTGPNSSISFIKNGLSPISYSGNINTNLQLGSDISNKIPFIGNQSVTLVINVADNESVHINDLIYKSSSTSINYKTLGIIFLIVFFIFNICM